MFRYLKAAFLVRPEVPGLGALPVNILLVAAMFILGLGHPAFWLLGIGLETAFLAGLSTNARFQKVVDALQLSAGEGDAESKRRALVHQLPATEQRRMADLEGRCKRAADTARAQGVEDYIIESNRDALNKLAWLYLKLLLVRQNLHAQETAANEANLRRQFAQLQRDSNDPKIGPALRESKAATSQILEKRLENLRRRAQSLAEIESDLTRIEAQVDLAVENAGMSGQPQAVSSKISLVSQLLEPDLFGVSQSAVADLDQTFGGAAARENA